MRCRQRRRTRRDHRRPRRLAAQSGRRQRRRRGAPPVPTTLNGDIPGLCRSSVHRSQAAPHCAAHNWCDVLAYCAGAVSRDPGGDSLQHYDRCDRRVTARAGGGPHAAMRACVCAPVTHACGCSYRALSSGTPMQVGAAVSAAAPSELPPPHAFGVASRGRCALAGSFCAFVCLFVCFLADRSIRRSAAVLHRLPLPLSRAHQSHLAVPTGPTCRQLFSIVYQLLFVYAFAFIVEQMSQQARIHGPEGGEGGVRK